MIILINMRKIKIVPNEYYHIYNRGNNKQSIFFDNRDWIRFLFLIIYFQAIKCAFYNLSRFVSHFVRHRVFNIKEEQTREIIKNRYTKLICFSLMPNHFHLLIQEGREKGIPQYMQRVLNAYTKYYNTKYEKSGHLFQGPYQIIHVKSNEQLLYLSAYIHRNPYEIREWKNKEEKYPWSSFQDYCDENRWGKLLGREIILGQFSSPKEYKKFVAASGAKSELDKNLLLEI